MRLLVSTILAIHLLAIEAIGATSGKVMPTASFNATTVCQGLQTVFTNNSSTPSGSIVANIWDFGDGNGSSVLNPKHIYSSSGLFTVTLTIITSEGDVDDYTADVTVYPSGTLNFNVASSDKCINSQFTFSNLSSLISGSFTSYSWDFGDGASAGTQNSTHAYSSSGTYTVKLTTLTNNNCSNSYSKTVDVYPKATVGFNVSDKCLGGDSKFTNTTTVASGMVSYAWTFGDNGTSNEINPEHEYATAGAYTVQLTATTDKGCQTQTSKVVNIHPVPQASFTVADHCFGVDAIFNNQSAISGGTLDYEWDFGDGTLSSDPAPSHAYQAVGNYEVKLSLTSDKGCTDDASDFLYVSARPVANFTIQDVCLGTNAEFFNNSTISEGEVTYAWTFGDGGTSQNINPLHSYGSYGTFDVTLKASNPNGGCDASITRQINVFQQPVASFDAADECLNTAVSFTNQTQFVGTDISYVWNFGNGNTSTDTDPVLQYTSHQTYTVTLTANAVNGCSDVFSKSIRIHPMPVANFLSSNICDTETASFENLSTIASGLVTSSWNFGDGEESQETSPQHLYASYGSYTVTLTMTSDKNCSTTKDKTVQVHALPVTSFDAPAVCDGKPATFTNLSTVATGTIASYQWDFGDETTSIIKTPSKQYLNDGTYTVTLVSTSNYGCQTSAQSTITVYPPAIASFSVEDVCDAELIETSNSSSISSGTLTYEWDFGDGTSSIATAPTHQYATAGVYAIKLVTTSDKGCQDSVMHPVVIFNLPEVSAGEDQTISQGYPAQLNATGAIEYAWSPIDGLDNSSVPYPNAAPMQTTTYIVFAKDKFGCESSDTVTVYVNNEYKLVATNVLTPDNNGSNDTWKIENVETFGDVNVKVFDRWGTLVYQQNAYKNDWRGTSGSDLLPDGTYYYYITFSSSSRAYKGALTILRNRK